MKQSIPAEREVTVVGEGLQLAIRKYSASKTQGKIIGSPNSADLIDADRYYDPADEGRLPYDHSDIGYDRETQRK